MGSSPFMRTSRGIPGFFYTLILADETWKLTKIFCLGFLKIDENNLTLSHKTKNAMPMN